MLTTPHNANGNRATHVLPPKTRNYANQHANGASMPASDIPCASSVPIRVPRSDAVRPTRVRKPSSQITSEHLDSRGTAAQLAMGNGAIEIAAMRLIKRSASRPGPLTGCVNVRCEARECSDAIPRTFARTNENSFHRFRWNYELEYVIRRPGLYTKKPIWMLTQPARRALVHIPNSACRRLYHEYRRPARDQVALQRIQ